MQKSTSARKKKSKASALVNSPSNWFAAEDENYHYICNTEQSYSIYKISKDEAEPVRLNEDETWYLNLSGDWLYYSNKSDQGHIYKIKKNGTERTKVCEDSAAYLNVDNDWLYYCNSSDNNRIYKVKSDGSNRECLSDGSAAYLCLHEDWLVYANLSDGSKIYKLRADGSENIKLGDDKAKFLSVMNEWVYYSNEDKYGSLHRLGLDSHEKVVLNDERSEYVIAKEDFIYYTCAYRDCSLFRIRPDGKGRKKLIDAEADYNNCLSNSIYYLNFSQGGKLYISNMTGTVNEAVGIEESKGIKSDVAKLKRGNSAGNIVNSCKTAIDGEWIYYCEMLPSYKEYTYKENIHGSGRIGIDWGGYLNVIDGWLYYTGPKGIFKKRTDGSGNIIVDNDSAKYMSVVGEWIYYINETDKGKIYKIRIDGSDKTRIADDKATCLNYSDQWLVFINLGESSPKEVNQLKNSDPGFGRIYKMKHDGSELSPVGVDETRLICVGKDWVYYLNRNKNNSIYRVNINTSAAELIKDVEACTLNYSDNWLYYIIKKRYKYEIYKIRPNGTGLKSIFETNSYIDTINVLGRWIYFHETHNDWQSIRIRTDGSGYTSLCELNKSANYLRVKFDDGNSYIYRTLDRDIKLGSKVMVEGKKVGLMGVVVEEKAKLNKRVEAEYISKVVEYGTGNIDELSEEIKEDVNRFATKKRNRNNVLEIKTEKKNKSMTIYVKSKGLEVVEGTVVQFTESMAKDEPRIGVVVNSDAKKGSASNLYEITHRYPDGTSYEAVLREAREKEKQEKKLQERDRAIRKKLAETSLVKIEFKDGMCFSYINTDPKLNVGSTVKVIRGGGPNEGRVVKMNDSPNPMCNYPYILEVISYGSD